MFVDASALCAVLLDEPDADVFARKIADAEVLLTSPLAIYETVLGQAHGLEGDIGAARQDVAEFLRMANFVVVTIGDAERELALDAFTRYGKGRHRAGLNMGDCFAYACARTHGVPLLFKGDDFMHTDVTVA